MGWGNNHKLGAFLPAPWTNRENYWNGMKILFARNGEWRRPEPEPGIQVEGFVREQIALRKKNTLPPDEEEDEQPRDFIESFLFAQRRNKCEGHNSESEFYGKDAGNFL